MARILRFVDYEYSKTGGVAGNILLDINDGTDYCMDIECDIPSPDIEWRNPAHLNGREPSRFKYPNINVNVTGHVYGTDKADLSANIRALFERFNASNPILEWRPDGWTDALYIDLIDPPLDIDVSDWFEAKIRDNPYINVLANIDVHCEAKPFGRRPEETIWIAKHLGTNDSMEGWTGLNLDDFTIVTAGGGTVTKDNANQLDGNFCVDLSTAGGGADSAAIVDTNFIPVDELRHFNDRIYAKRLSVNAVAFDVDVACYDNTPALLGTLNMLVGDNVDVAWEDPVEKSPTTGVIHPSPDADPFSFPVGTTQIKRTFRNDSAVASQMVIDCAWFGDSEYFTRDSSIAGSGLDCNRIENPATVKIPSDELFGDVPSPARLFSVWNQFYGLPVTELHPKVHWSGTRECENTKPVLILKPNPGDTTHQQIGMIDQKYERFTGVAGAVSFSPLLDIEVHAGRYVPIIKLRYNQASPDTVTVTLRTQILAFGMEDVSVAIYESANTDWHTSGHYDSATEYFTPNFVPMDIPYIRIPEGATLAGLSQTIAASLVMSTAGNVDIDYLMLIPIETYSHFGFIDADTFLLLGYLVNGYERLMARPQVASSYDLEDFALFINGVAGNMNPFVYPKGTNIVLCEHNEHHITVAPNVDGRDCHPIKLPDVLLQYNPLYLLVPEE